MSMLKMMIIPLIVSNLVASLASLDSAMSGKLGYRAVVYYLATTILAVALGIVLVLIINPVGRVINRVGPAKETEESTSFGLSFILFCTYVRVMP